MPVQTKPVMNANVDGNIFAVTARACEVLRDAGQREQARELRTLVQGASSYDEALRIIGEYVEYDFSGRTVLNGAGALPAGKYLVVDPCYVFEDNIYNYLLDSGAFDGERPYEYGDGKMVWILRTAHGDGAYTGSDGRMYFVDSAHIAIIEVGQCPRLFFKNGWEDYSMFVVGESFDCAKEDTGELVFGNFLTIPTDGERCDDCGGRYCACDVCGRCTNGECECGAEEEEDDED